MKKLIIFILFLGIVTGCIYYFRGEISQFIYKLALDNVEISVLEPNEYYRANNYHYVQITDDFIAKSKQHLLNIYYTIINAGEDEFTFKCDISYKNCVDDIKIMTDNQTIFSNLNSLVHPFNRFSNIETMISPIGEVFVKIYKDYSEDDIIAIKNKMQEIIKNVVGNVTDKKQIIRLIHNYIINNTKYDSLRSDEKIVNYKSDTAYGPLYEGYGLCGGYTDAMALFLDYYKIPNFKIISENHIWNAVYVDNTWYHLDLTWDDPVNKNGRDVLEYTFFLITSDELWEIEKEQHIFDKEVYYEMVEK